MADLRIREYATPLVQANGIVQIAKEPGILDQAPVNIGGLALSQPFNAATRTIRVDVDATCSFVIGPASLVLTNQSPRMYTNTVEYFGVDPGNILQVIASS